MNARAHASSMSSPMSVSRMTFSLACALTETGSESAINVARIQRIRIILCQLSVRSYRDRRFRRARCDTFQLSDSGTKRRHAVNQRFSRRYFFYGTLFAGAVPSGGFGSTPSLSGLGYKSPNEKLNIGAVGVGIRGPAILVGAA